VKIRPYTPRRKYSRMLLKKMIGAALHLTSRFEVEGRENIPSGEPLLLIANHFSHVDPLVMIHVAPTLVEFWGGQNMLHTPPILRMLPKLWDFYPVTRGGVSRDAVLAARRVLNGGALFGVFPEAGAWANVLRPGRPGAALLAIQTGVRVIPMGFHGADQVLPNIKRPHRPPLQVCIGQPLGPFSDSQSGRASREQLGEITDEMMRAIAALLPPARRGIYSDDPVLRTAAEAVSAYPWENVHEDELSGRTVWER
jgi:1-acyl-sn-glycerol-3-phosphate acyltransferase